MLGFTKTVWIPSSFRALIACRKLRILYISYIPAQRLHDTNIQALRHLPAIFLCQIYITIPKVRQLSKALRLWPHL